MIVLIFLVVLLAVVALALLVKLSQSRQVFQVELKRREEANQPLAIHAASYQHKLKALAEGSRAGMIVLDPHGKILETNLAATQILGAEGQDLRGHALIQATRSNAMQEFVMKEIGQGRAATKDFPMPGTQERIVKASVFPLPAGLAGVEETMVVLVDVSELHRLETIRRDFVANVSHELRTPLASIRAIAETLYEGAVHDEEVAGPFLETIIRETDRLGRISEDLLILSDAESKAPTKEWFDLTVLLRDIVTRSQKRAQQHGITLSLQSPGPLNVFASRDQIEQVMVNLTDNGIKYTGDGGNVCVEASSTPEETLVSVSDTGIGIMHQDLPRIFERFYRVDKARSRESGGTGLGLSIVKNIIEAHGGNVKVASEFNRGSTFTVSLPAIKES